MIQGRAVRQGRLTIGNRDRRGSDLYESIVTKNVTRMRLVSCPGAAGGAGLFHENKAV